jgi:recombination protein RecA
LTTVAPWRQARQERAETGVPSLDAIAGGGVPRGHLSEIVGARSAGRTALLTRALAAAAARGEAVALIDPCDRFDPGSAADLDLDRLLWVRGSGSASCPQTALKAMNLVLQAGNFGLVALDLADVPPAAMRAFPFTTWLRMARVIEGSQTAALLVAAAHVARSAGGLTLVLDRPSDHAHVAWSGTSQRARLLTAITLHPRTIAAHSAANGEP